MNGLLVLIGVVLIVIGVLILMGLNSASSYLNQSITPNPVINSVGQSENNIFGTVGWGLIIIGGVIVIIGLFFTEGDHNNRI